MWCYSYFKDTPWAPPLVGSQWEMENLCLSLWHLDLHLNPDKGLAIKHSTPKAEEDFTEKEAAVERGVWQACLLMHTAEMSLFLTFKL